MEEISSLVQDPWQKHVPVSDEAQTPAETHVPVSDEVQTPNIETRELFFATFIMLKVLIGGAQGQLKQVLDLITDIFSFNSGFKVEFNQCTEGEWDRITNFIIGLTNTVDKCIEAINLLKAGFHVSSDGYEYHPWDYLSRSAVLILYGALEELQDLEYFYLKTARSMYKGADEFLSNLRAMSTDEKPLMENLALGNWKRFQAHVSDMAAKKGAQARPVSITQIAAKNISSEFMVGLYCIGHLGAQELKNRFLKARRVEDDFMSWEKRPLSAKEFYELEVAESHKKWAQFDQDHKDALEETMEAHKAQKALWAQEAQEAQETQEAQDPLYTMD